jgi:Mitochondrial carrier protein
MFSDVLMISVGGKFAKVLALQHLFEHYQQVTTLGQPLEVLKTQMAANRSESMIQAFRTIWSRGGVLGFYQGLIPWVCQFLAPHFRAT